MLLDSKQIIPITQLQKQLTRKVRELSDSGEALYILKNNNMEAVMLSFEEYEFLHDLEEMFEQFEIKSMLDKRIENYNSDLNISWDSVREDS
jgi:PHD/YefM family antitoxin component YafN of YafNO toxin-antitoxin module